MEQTGAYVGAFVLAGALLYFCPIVSPISLVIFYLVWTNTP
jgi:hypothetical protein